MDAKGNDRFGINLTTRHAWAQWAVTS